MGIKRLLIVFTFLTFSIIPVTQASAQRRQELPAERQKEETKVTEREEIEEPEEKPVPGEKRKPSAFSLKRFYKDHFNIIFGVSEQWDSNILLDEEDEEDDFITVLNPDVTLHFGNDQGYIEGEWIGRYAYYADSDEITNSNSVSALTFLTPNDRFAVGARGNFDITDESLVPTFFGDRILQLGYTIISTQPQIKYRLFDRLTSDFSYQFDKIDVDNSDLDDAVDREGHNFTSNFEFEASPTLFLFGGYGFRDVGYGESASKDSFSHLPFAGIRKKIPNLFNVEAKATYHDKGFDRSPDDRNVDISGGITSTFSRYTTLIFNAGYGLQESSRSEFTQYTSSRFSLILQHYITSKTVLILKGSYELQSFDGEDILVTFVTGDQDTDLYNASVDIRQMIFSWLSFEVGYSFQERDTDFASEDLQDHIVRTTVKAYF